MAQEVYRLADLQGLTPAVDPTRSEKQFALNGRNYLFDAIGPKSPFGNRFLLPHSIQAPQFIQDIRLKLRGVDRVFTITTQAIMEWQEDPGAWRIIQVIPDTSTAPFRWSWGYLSGAMFFCHPRTGIIFYSLDNDIAGSLTGPGVPTDALSIVVNNGILVALTPEYLMWSDPSDGTNFAPKLGGAGFQLISARIPGYPVCVTAYAGGVLTWTNGGVLRSEFSGGQEVFRHRALNTEYRPINSFCTFKADDDTVVILDERGLFQSKGEAPTAFTPLFNEFLIEWMKDSGAKYGNNVRLEWDELQRHLYLSYSASRYDPIYEKTFVLYPATDKWGEFNEPHYGIGPVKIASGEREGDYYGFTDINGRKKYWTATGSREVPGLHRTDDLHYPVVQIPFHADDGGTGTVLASVVGFGTVPARVGRAGYYPLDGNNVVPSAVTGLDALIQFGLFRTSKDMSHDELSEMSQVLVRSNQSGPTDRVSGEFSLSLPNPQGYDYSINESQYYRLEELNYVNHKLRLIASNDGTTEFMSAEPELVGFSRSARHYACSVVGIWHIVELSAIEVGEAFHLRTLELTGVSAGRLM